MMKNGYDIFYLQPSQCLTEKTKKMSTMKRIFYLIIIVIVFSLVFASCGGGVGTGNNKTTGGGTAAINLPWTGQAMIYAAGDDGDLEKGVASRDSPLARIHCKAIG